MNFEDRLKQAKKKRTSYKPPVQKVAAVEVPTTVVMNEEYKKGLHKEAIKQGVHMRELFIVACRRFLNKHESGNYLKAAIPKSNEWRTNYYISADLSKDLHDFKVEHSIFLKQIFNEAVRDYLDELKPKKSKVKQMTISEGIEREKSV